MSRLRTTLPATVCLLLGTAVAVAQQRNLPPPDVGTSRFDTDIVADGLVHPWGLDFLPGGGAVVTERPGRIKLVIDGKVSEPLPGVPEVFAHAEGGLLVVAVSPDFETDGLIFFSYSQPGSGGSGTAVSRARLVLDEASPRLEAVETIFSMSRKTGSSHHFGSRLVFGPDGALFVTTGDRDEGDRAQDMQDHAGAVIRIAPDGSVPEDNPKPDGWLPELWSKGHRNVQGAMWDPVTNALITVEHGVHGGDEVNLTEAGKNYGWPLIAYGIDYSGESLGVGTEAEGLEQPLYYWDPAIAPSGAAVYQGAMFPEWEGDILIGALRSHLTRIDRDESGALEGEERLLERTHGRIRDVNVAPDGSVWLLTDETDGAIVRLSRKD